MANKLPAPVNQTGAAFYESAVIVTKKQLTYDLGESRTKLSICLLNEASAPLALSWRARRANLESFQFPSSSFATRKFHFEQSKRKTFLLAIRLSKRIRQSEAEAVERRNCWTYENLWCKYPDSSVWITFLLSLFANLSWVESWGGSVCCCGMLLSDFRKVWAR